MCSTEDEVPQSCTQGIKIILPFFFRVKYREEQLRLHNEAKQKAKELALEQEQEKERRLDKLRQQVHGFLHGKM